MSVIFSSRLILTKMTDYQSIMFITRAGYLDKLNSIVKSKRDSGNQYKSSTLDDTKKLIKIEDYFE